MLRVLCMFTVWVLPLVAAQFNFFDMFNHGNQGHQNRGSGGSQWVAQADNTPCNAYLCPDTLMCVRNPAECPCPSPEDIKCLIHEPKVKDAATVICTRGGDACAEVQRLASKWR